MRATKILLALLAVVLVAGAVSLWALSWPWRLAARAAGITSPRRSRAVTASLIESTLALALSAFGLVRRNGRIRPAWEPCAQCGGPNYRRSAFCSDSCRRWFEIHKREALISDEAVPF